MSKGGKLRKKKIYMWKGGGGAKARIDRRKFFNCGVQMLEEINFCLKKHAKEALCIVRVHDFLNYKAFHNGVGLEV
jgi:hypothetical protein